MRRESPSSQSESMVIDKGCIVSADRSQRLWMQRRSWAMDVLRSEGIRSVSLSPLTRFWMPTRFQVLDIGCGPGALLETLINPASTIYEQPIRPNAERHDDSTLPSPANSEDELLENRELFINVRRTSNRDAPPR